MNILALDVSLSKTGYADDGGVGVLVPPKEFERGIPRLQWIRRKIIDRAKQADIVLIEGYAYAAQGRAVISLAELGGVIRVALTDFGISYVEVSPASLKLFATGKGNANKEMMLVAAVKQLGYEGHSPDVADALWLRTFGRHRAENRQSTEKQLKAIGGVDWRELDRKVLGVDVP